jgi:uroporphyrinogen-III synthase
VHPLAGRRVLITRAPHQASELAERLSELGAIPILIPTIEIVPPTSYAELDAALTQLDPFDLIVFTSANAVEAFQRRAGHLSIDLTSTPLRIAAVGPVTARALLRSGLHADILPPVYTAESLAATLAPTARGQQILLVLAKNAPGMLAAALASAGAHITIAPAYLNRIPAQSLTAIGDLFADSASYPDAITFTSASTAHNLVALLEAGGLILSATVLPAAILRASIGPITSRALRSLNLPPHIEASEPTVAALATALAEHFRDSPPQQ